MNFSAADVHILQFRKSTEQLHSIHYTVCKIGETYIIGIYVHPATPQKQLFAFLKQVEVCFENFSICGDFNGHCYSFGLPMHQQVNPLGNAIDRFLDQSTTGAAPFCSIEPTFISNVNSYLDGTITNVPVSHNPTGYSIFKGHKTQLIELSVNFSIDTSAIQDSKYKRTFTDWTSFAKQVLEEQPPVFETPYEFFQRCVLIADSNRLEDEDSRLKYHPWWNDKCKAAVRCKRKALKKLQNSTSYEEFLQHDMEWKKAKKDCQSVIEQAKQRYACTVIKSLQHNPWKAIRILTGGKKKKLPFVDPGTATLRAATAADAYRQVAADVPPLSQQMKAYLQHLKDNNTPLQIERWELGFAIGTLRRHSTPGFDKVTSILLKKLYHFVPDQLLHQFNLMSKQLEPEFKHSVIHPIPKPPPSLESRPISLLNHSCKILEKIVAMRLLRDLERSIFRNQFCGTGRGTETALLQVFSTVKQMGDSAILLFVDIQKAFDRLSHTLLIQKLLNLGVETSLIMWLSDWIQHRTWSVRCHSIFSPIYHLLAGIPQGSPLSALLFKIYISDLKTAILEVLYMDDLLAIASNYSQMERACKKLEEWASLNFVKFNEEKTRLMFASNLEGEDSCICLQGWTIPVTTSYKYLGIVLQTPVNGEFILSEELKIEKSEIKKRISMLKKFHHFSGQNLRTILQALVISKIDYGLSIKRSIIQGLQSLQDEAIRTISDCKFQANKLAELWKIKTVAKRWQDRLWNIQTK